MNMVVDINQYLFDILGSIIRLRMMSWKETQQVIYGEYGRKKFFSGRHCDQIHHELQYTREDLWLNINGST